MITFMISFQVNSDRVASTCLDHLEFVLSPPSFLCCIYELKESKQLTWTANAKIVLNIAIYRERIWTSASSP